MPKTLPESVLPVYRPPFPDIRGLSPEEGKRTLENFLAQWEWSSSENEHRFDEAMILIKRCAFWQGFLNVFGTGDPLHQHFSWCPAPAWRAFWNSSQFHWHPQP